MGRTTFHWILMITFSMAAGWGEQAQAAELRLTVRVYNFAQVPKATLSGATEKATAVYGRMGIEVDWANCPLESEALASHAGCNAKGPHMLTVKILPESMAKVYYNSRHSLGFAVLSERAGSPPTHLSSSIGSASKPRRATVSCQRHSDMRWHTSLDTFCLARAVTPRPES